VPQHFVGVISFGSFSLEILPKIENTGESEIRRNLLHMLAVCRKLDVRESQIARLARKPMNILEIFIGIFCEKLFEQVHRGLIHRYETLEENISMLRGTLMMPEQMKNNNVRKERFFCRFDEFRTDNPYNRVLKSALMRVKQISRNEDNRRLIHKLLAIFEDVAMADATSEDIKKLSFDRTTRRFESLFEMAGIILSGFTPDVTTGSHLFYALLFDMNELFEEYISRMVQRFYKQKAPVVYLQGPHKYLVKEHCEEGKHHFGMKPDIVIKTEDRIEKIIDTKWKKLSETDRNLGVSHADIYQVYAYAHRYMCPEVMLLYPHHSALSSDPGNQRKFKVLKETEEEMFMNVATVSLADLRDIQDQLGRILE
jgi:5-methylcytosine-specific restriction enzyme subunit McrC